VDGAASRVGDSRCSVRRWRWVPRCCCHRSPAPGVRDAVDTTRLPDAAGCPIRRGRGAHRPGRRGSAGAAAARGGSGAGREPARRAQRRVRGSVRAGARRRERRGPPWAVRVASAADARALSRVLRRAVAARVGVRTVPAAPIAGVPDALRVTWIDAGGATRVVAIAPSGRGCTASRPPPSRAHRRPTRHPRCRRGAPAGTPTRPTAAGGATATPLAVDDTLVAALTGARTTARGRGMRSARSARGGPGGPPSGRPGDRHLPGRDGAGAVPTPAPGRCVAVDRGCGRRGMSPIPPAARVVWVWRPPVPRRVGGRTPRGRRPRRAASPFAGIGCGCGGGPRSGGEPASSDGPPVRPAHRLVKAGDGVPRWRQFAAALPARRAAVSGGCARGSTCAAPPAGGGAGRARAIAGAPTVSW